MILDLSFPRLALRKPVTSSEVACQEDKELARRVAAGEGDAVAEVYDLYAASLYRTLCALLGSTSDAEDALQEVFAKLAGGRLKQARDLRAYLFVAARNEAFSILRRRKREQAWPLEEDNSREPIELPTPEWNQPLGSDLLALLQQLPIEQREVIALKVAENLTFAEIAALLKISPNTAASRYRYGIERLRSWWQEENSAEVNR